MEFQFMKRYLIAMAMVLALAASSNAQVLVTTEFDTSDGFVTGGTADVVVDGLVTFSGGQQQQMFLGAAYNNGPAGYLFINCLLYTSPSPRDATLSRMPSSA